MRALNDWEVDLVVNLLLTLQNVRVFLGVDKVHWKRLGGGGFSMRDAYNILNLSHSAPFPAKGIWVSRVPPKLAFFTQEAALGKVLTLDTLQRRGWQFPNRCYLCGQAEEPIHHILLRCSVASSLWVIIFSLVEFLGPFPKR